MKRFAHSMWWIIPAALMVAVLSAPRAAWASAPLAYVGPGAGLSMLGALAAVMGVIGLGLLGPLLYPVVLLKRWYHRRQPLSPEDE